MPKKVDDIEGCTIIDLGLSISKIQKECPASNEFKLIQGKCYAFENVLRTFDDTQVRCSQIFGSTGKYFSEALILASVNPQYDKRLFIEFPEKYKFTAYCVQKLFFCFDIQNNNCTQHVGNLFFSGNSMNNLL